MSAQIPRKQKIIRAILLQDQQFLLEEWELSARDSIFKHKTHHKLTVSKEEMGTLCIDSHRQDPLHPITEHKRLSPLINLSFFPPLKRKQDASARLSIGLIPRSIPLQDTSAESPQPTHPHFKAALGEKDFNPSLWLLELKKQELFAPLQQSSHCWCYCHIVVVTAGIVHGSLWNSKLWVKSGNQQQGLLAGVRWKEEDLEDKPPSILSFHWSEVLLWF